MTDIQLEAVFFRARAFAGKIVLPSDTYSEQLADDVCEVGARLFHADGWRVTYGPHNATEIKKEKNAPPVDQRSGVARAVPTIGHVRW